MQEETDGDSWQIIEKIEEQIPVDQPRLRSYVSALKESLKRSRDAQVETNKQLAEFEDAYAKLTAPANRTGVFLRWLSDEETQGSNHPLALVALGDAEYVSEVDPKFNKELLAPGVGVRLNEAYAIINLLTLPSTGRIEKVSEVLDDGRLKLGSGPASAGGRVIDRSPQLMDTTIRAGDEVRFDPSGRIAVEVYAGNESKDYFLEEVPVLPWDKIGGQTEAIQLIRETIEQPLLYPDLFKKFEKKPIKGVLLYGPPGCGKTLIGKATAYNLTREYAALKGKEVQEYFMAISGPKILNMWLGETERIVREIFKTAREKAKEGHLVFIFMDEAESILRTRSSGRWLNISNTVVPQFCAELDGLQSLENVVLILTSNRPDYIDPAVLRPERIDRKVKVSRPDKAAAAQIMGIYLHADIPLEPKFLKEHDNDVDCARKAMIETVIDEIWATNPSNEFLKVGLKNGTSESLFLKDVVSGALLKSVVDRAKDLAIKRMIQKPRVESGVSLDDLRESMRREFKENEIFPTSDLTEDWLELLDYPIESVVSVKPVGRSKGERISRRSII